MIGNFKMTYIWILDSSCQYSCQAYCEILKGNFEFAWLKDWKGTCEFWNLIFISFVKDGILGSFSSKTLSKLEFCVAMAIWYERHIRGYLFKEIWKNKRWSMYLIFTICDMIFAIESWIWSWAYKRDLTTNIFVWLNQNFYPNF